MDTSVVQIIQSSESVSDKILKIFLGARCAVEWSWNWRQILEIASWIDKGLEPCINWFCTVQITLKIQSAPVRKLLKSIRGGLLLLWWNQVIQSSQLRQSNEFVLIPHKLPNQIALAKAHFQRISWDVSTPSFHREQSAVGKEKARLSFSLVGRASL